MQGACVKASWIFLALLFVLGTANAQLYRWVDKDGKVRYGDTPPAGAKTSTVKPPPAPPEAADRDAKEGNGRKDAKKKEPLTAAEKEQDYRKRREEAQKAAEQEEEESRAKAARADNCNRAKEQLITLQSGGRIVRTSSNGELLFLNEAQVAQEVARAEQLARQYCN